MPYDVIASKKGVHFAEDFECVSKLPSVRSTAQNYNLECRVTGKSYICQTLLYENQIKGGPDVDN